jgi:hypothetical protein
VIVIKLEMWPKGDSSRARSLGVGTISNVGGSADTGDYEVRLFKSAEYSRTAETRPLEERLRRPLARETWKLAAVHAFPRVRLGPWDLLLRGLCAAVGMRNQAAVENLPDVDFGPAPDMSMTVDDDGEEDWAR